MSIEMNAQKRDLIIGQKNVWGDDAGMLCECGQPTEPHSCYCRACEDRIYNDEEFHNVSNY